MSGFEPQWLDLREPYDHRARAPGPAAAMRAWAEARGQLTIVDLGTGTGSSLRAMGRWLPSGQEWRAVDDDPVLLSRIEAVPPSGRVVAVRADLATALGPDLVAGADLLTASALIDLVGERWLADLAELCRKARIPAYLALTVGDRVDWQPVLAADAPVMAAFAQHQGRDKGFGAALGGQGAARQAAVFAAAGFRIHSGESPWILGPADRRLQTALARGYADAARAQDPELGPLIQEWLAARLALIAQGASHHWVGHQDLWAEPG